PCVHCHPDVHGGDARAGACTASRRRCPGEGSRRCGTGAGARAGLARRRHDLSAGGGGGGGAVHGGQVADVLAWRGSAAGGADARRACGRDLGRLGSEGGGVMLTEQEVYEAALRRWQERYEHILDQVPVLLETLRDAVNPLKASRI